MDYVDGNERYATYWENIKLLTIEKVRTYIKLSKFKFGLSFIICFCYFINEDGFGLMQSSNDIAEKLPKFPGIHLTIERKPHTKQLTESKSRVRVIVELPIRVLRCTVGCRPLFRQH